MNRKWFRFLILGLVVFFFWGCAPKDAAQLPEDGGETGGAEKTVPEYDGEPWVELHGNMPYFDETDLTTEAFESYSPLDALGRCGAAYANICEELMPTEERGEIGQVKPSGWHTVKYDCVDGKYLYNRCHLIGYQLSGENANEKNLMTGTRYMNTEGMLPFENKVAEYVQKTGNHVLYRVTPVFEGDNLLASGVMMEAYSVEDQGNGIKFCVFCYNVQPGIVLDYATGESHEAAGETEIKQPEEAVTYVINTNTHKFHLPDCSSVKEIKLQNREEFTGTREEAVAQGYDPCGRCNP